MHYSGLHRQDFLPAQRTGVLIRFGVDTFKRFQSFAQCAFKVSDHQCLKFGAGHNKGFALILEVFLLQQVPIGHSLFDSGLTGPVGAGLHLLARAADAKWCATPLIDHAINQQVPELLGKVAATMIKSLVPVTAIKFQRIHPHKDMLSVVASFFVTVWLSLNLAQGPLHSVIIEMFNTLGSSYLVCPVDWELGLGTGAGLSVEQQP